MSTPIMALAAVAIEIVVTGEFTPVGILEKSLLSISPMILIPKDFICSTFFKLISAALAIAHSGVKIFSSLVS
jgi:hypothetical protein